MGAPGQRAIGFVTQRPTLFPHMNVTANVAFGLSGLERRSSEERVGQMLELFQAGHLAKRMSSRSFRRREAAGGAGSCPRSRTAPVLLDEPFTGLDADLKVSILEQLTAWLAEREIPALYVSHDVAEAFQTAADVMVIDSGQIQAHGPAQVVLASRREQLLRQLGEG